MAQACVFGSCRPGIGVAATVARVRAALSAAGLDVASDDTADGDGPLVIVDPATWYAMHRVAPSANLLRRAVGLSLAPYGSPAMQEDAAVGPFLGAIVHPEARSAEHLARLGCRAAHVALGCSPLAPPPSVDRSVPLATFGPAAPRRLRTIAFGAQWLDDLRVEHRFDDELPAACARPDADHLLARATVLVDVAPDDDAALDSRLLLAAVEHGVALVTERLGGDLPEGLEESIVRAPAETLFARGRELALDPELARRLAASAHRAAAEAWPLAAMGHALAEVLAELPQGDGAPTARRPPLTHQSALPPRPSTVAGALAAERQRPGASVGHALRRVTARVTALERSLARLERGTAADAVELVHEQAGDEAPIVSVLVPCHAARRHVLSALGSVAEAAAEPDAPAIELIVVDDDSPQGEGRLAADWAEGRPNLAVVVLRHTCNRGLAAARNTALGRARGELVLPLDADNRLRPGGLRKLVDRLQHEPDADFAYGLLQEFDATGPVGLRGLYPWDPNRLRYGNYIDAMALVRREALTDVGGYADDMPEQGYEDWDLWCRFAERGVVGAWVPEMVASYRVSPVSMSADLHLSHLAPLADMLERHPALLG